ncbi:MAG: DUF721 domain-containing protein [Bacteroidaceae bacterium]
MKHRNAESIDSIINRFLRQEGLETPLNQFRLIDAWTEVMGQAISRYTGDMYIKSEVLHVQFRSPALKANLMMDRKNLVRRLNEYVGSQVIVDIVFH